MLLEILPLILVVLHTTISVIYGNLEASSTNLNNIFLILIIIIILFFLIPLLIWVHWLYGAGLSVKQKELGISKKGFSIAYIIFLLYILFNIFLSHIQLIPEALRYILYTLSEWINFVGLLVAYPLICHDAARSIYIKKHNKVASFSKTIGYTILLIFLPFSIPFFHKYFSSLTTENWHLIKIYWMALGLLILLAVSALVLAILGLI